MNDQFFIGVLLLMFFCVLLGVCGTMAVYKTYLYRKRKQLSLQIIEIRMLNEKNERNKNVVKPDYDEDDCEDILP